MGRGTMGRMAAWVLAMVVGLPVLAYAGLVAINWNDEPPSAEAERLLALLRDRPPLADSANGYIHARDLAAVPGGDPEYREARSPQVGELASACSEAPACEEALDAQPGVAAEWLESEQWLIERYRRMLATPGWREPLLEDAHAPLTPYQHVMEGQKLHLVDMERHALAGDAAAVRDLLERDLVFWRRVLASSDLLITKTIATVAVGRNLAFGNLALRKLAPESVDSAVPPSWRVPLTVAERSYARPLGGEWHWVAGTLRQAYVPGVPGAGTEGDAADRLMRPLFQQQATLNLVASRMVRVGELSELPYEELDAALARQVEAPGPSLRFPLYNPAGTLVGSAVSDVAYAGYVTRTSDLEGRRRATLLAATLRSARIGAEGAESAVQESSLRNPYNDAPFQWDPANGAVVFNGLEEGERGRHAVLL